MAPNFEIQNLLTEIREGGFKYVAILGGINSGKSRLVGKIVRLLADQPKPARRRCAFVSENPWIFTGSIKENIVFSRHDSSRVDKRRYGRVLDVCALRKDLTTIKNGDAHEIGSQGSNISGGQKRRIALARALYLEADLNIFDDFLSSLNSEIR